MNMPGWPEWQTVKLIGRGSYGEVYEIQKQVFEHTDRAALKVITIPQDSSEIEELYNDGYDTESITEYYKNYVKSIVQEYNLMTELKGNHNIVHCDDIRCVRHDDGIGWDLYIKMELLTPLTKWNKILMNEQQIIKLGLDMCNALIACKTKKIIHRDIKPQNIFVTENGDFKLGDFGIAKTSERTSSGTKTGTYKYMAPEIYNNEPYGALSDMYSLGLVLYCMLNARCTPFLPLPPQIPTVMQDNEATIKRMNGQKIPEPLYGSEKLKAIVLKACEYNPSDRYSSFEEMRNELLEIFNLSSERDMNEASYKWDSEVMDVYDIQKIEVSFGDCPIVNISFDGTKLIEKNTIDGSRDGWMTFPENFFAEKTTRLSQKQRELIFEFIEKIDFSKWETKQYILENIGAEGFCIHNKFYCIFQNGRQFKCLEPNNQEFERLTNILLDMMQCVENDISTKEVEKKRSIALILAVFPWTGIFGVHDFYLGKKKNGIFKLCTLNLFTIGWFVDIGLILAGKYKTKNGDFLK